MDLNDRYGRWTTHPQPGVRYRKLDKIPCTCDCGTTREVRRDKLEYGLSLSCGCLTKDQLSEKKFPNLAPEHSDTVEPGARFGRWTVLTHPRPGKDRNVDCRCDCGNTKTIAVRHLLNNRSKSCGCLRREGARVMLLGD